MSLGSTREDQRPAMSLLDQFDAFMLKVSKRNLGKTLEFGSTQVPSMVDNPVEAQRRADREARLPVGRYMGFSVYLDPSLAPGAWEMRGQGRVEMCKSTFSQLTVEIQRRGGTMGVDDVGFGL